MNVDATKGEEMQKIWVKGERKLLVSKDTKGRETVRLGKNGGPVVQQEVTLILAPKVVR
jgi:hypothetical protein